MVNCVNMKYIYFLFLAFFSFEVFAGNCTTTTRTNYSNGQVLTSTALNADFNQLVSKVNSLDGGCVTDGTLEAASLNATDFAAVTNGIHQGCALSYSDANTISVGKCILSIGGNFVRTNVATTVTWGCSGCSSELSSTLYYVYARSTSSGTTLNLLISTSAPTSDGYDGSGNKVLGKFYNGSGSAIDQYGPETWTNGTYSKEVSKNSNPGVNREMDSFWFYFKQSGGTFCTSSPCQVVQFGDAVTSLTRAGTGDYTMTTKKSYQFLLCEWTPSMSVRQGTTQYGIRDTLGNTLAIGTIGYNGTNYAQEDSQTIVKCMGY